MPQKDDSDQRMACTATIHYSKYTTLNIFAISEISAFTVFLIDFNQKMSVQHQFANQNTQQGWVSVI